MNFKNRKINNRMHIRRNSTKTELFARLIMERLKTLDREIASRTVEARFSIINSSDNLEDCLLKMKKFVKRECFKFVERCDVLETIPREYIRKIHKNLIPFYEREWTSIAYKKETILERTNSFGILDVFDDEDEADPFGFDKRDIEEQKRNEKTKQILEYVVHEVLLEKDNIIQENILDYNKMIKVMYKRLDEILSQRDTIDIKNLSSTELNMYRELKEKIKTLFVKDWEVGHQKEFEKMLKSTEETLAQEQSTIIQDAENDIDCLKRLNSRLDTLIELNSKDKFILTEIDAKNKIDEFRKRMNDGCKHAFEKARQKA
eukprot:UN02034